MSDATYVTDEEKRRRWIAEVDNIHADTQLKLRQRQFEPWKVIVPATLLTAIVVQIANLIWA